MITPDKILLFMIDLCSNNNPQFQTLRQKINK